MNHLKILCDVDDVAIDLTGSWTCALNERYGTNISAEAMSDQDITHAFPPLAKEQVLEVVQAESFWQTVSPIQDSQRYLSYLHREGHEIYMVTETDYQICKAKVDRILELFPFLDAKHVIIAHNKQMIQGDVMIDDGPHNLKDGNFFRILFDRPHNRSFEERRVGMYRAAGWKEVYNLIHQNLIPVANENYRRHYFM